MLMDISSALKTRHWTFCTGLALSKCTDPIRTPCLLARTLWDGERLGQKCFARHNDTDINNSREFFAPLLERGSIPQRPRRTADNKRVRGTASICPTLHTP